MASSLPRHTNVKREAHSSTQENYSFKRSEKKRDSKNRVSNVIWVTPISNFKEKVFEAKTLLLTTKRVIIKATSSSIPHAINLAMILQNAHSVAIETSTLTVYQSAPNYSNSKNTSPAIKIIVDLIAENKSAA